MPKIYATVSEETEDDLKNISEKTRESFSKTVHKIIELGLLSYKNQLNIEPPKYQKVLPEVNLKHTEYLLRILNINAEILRKLYNEPSKCTEKNADAILTEIKIHTQRHIKTKSNKV